MENFHSIKTPIGASKKPVKWLRSKDVRALINVSDSTLQSMRIAKVFPAYKLGSTWLYREDEIISALEEGRIK